MARLHLLVVCICEGLHDYLGFLSSSILNIFDYVANYEDRRGTTD